MLFSEGTPEQQAQMLAHRKHISKKYTREWPYCDEFNKQTTKLESLLRPYWPFPHCRLMMASIIKASWDNHDPLRFIDHWVRRVIDFIGYGVGFEILYEEFQNWQPRLLPIDNIPDDQKSAQELWAFDEAAKQGLVVPFEQMVKELPYGKAFEQIHLN